MKLYLVECVGLNYDISGAPDGLSYVVANTPDEAYGKVKNYLDKEKIGFDYERQLKKITVIAQEGKYPDFRMRLFL